MLVQSIRRGTFLKMDISLRSSSRWRLFYILYVNHFPETLQAATLGRIDLLQTAFLFARTI
jgi:hypothetical protein